MSEGFKNDAPKYDYNLSNIMGQIKEAVLTVNSSADRTYSNSVEIVDFDETESKATEVNSESYYEKESDYDKVNINSFTNSLTNGLKNKYGRDSTEYKALCKYLTGKKIGDILDEKGHIIINEEELAKIYDELEGKNNVYSNELGTVPSSEEAKEQFMNKIKKDLPKVSLGKYSKTLSNFTISEIVSDENGFDAVVFEQNGEYLIANTCADGASKQDVALIIYSSLYAQMGGDEFYNYIKPILGNSSLEIDAGNLGKITGADLAAAQDVYNAQRKASFALLEKYSKKGHINLSGYSMGGGIQLDSYIRFTEKHPDLVKNVHIDLYNPYVGFIEGNSDYIPKGSDLIENKKAKIKELVAKYGDNINIITNSGDVVTQFNSVIDCFGDSVTYVKGTGSAKLKDYGGDILKLIFNDKSRHALETISEDNFDSDGNIKKSIKDPKVQEELHLTLNKIAGGKYDSNSIGALLKDAFSNELKKLKNNFLNQKEMKDFEYLKGGINILYDDLINYIANNSGNINYEGFINAISPGLKQMLIAGARDKAGDYGWVPDKIVNDCLTNEEMEKGLQSFLNNKNNENQIKNFIGELLSGNTANLNTTAEDLATKLYWHTIKLTHPNRALFLEGIQNVQNCGEYFSKAGEKLSNWDIFGGIGEASKGAANVLVGAAKSYYGFKRAVGDHIGKWIDSWKWW